MRIEQSDGKFILHTTYMERLRARSIGARWNKKARTWEVPVSLFGAEKLMQIRQPNEDFTAVEEYLARWNREAPTVRPKTNITLLDHQVIGASRALDLGRYCLFPDMGTGKTGMALAVAQELFDRGQLRTVLVVAPVAVLENWKREVQKFISARQRTIYLSGLREDRIQNVDDVIYLRSAITGRFLTFALVNYDLLPRMEDDLLTLDADMVIFDESIRVKNRQAKTTKLSIRLADAARFVLILNGTPVSNDITELWSQCRVASPEFLGTDYWMFAYEFAKFGGFKGKQIVGAKNLEFLDRLLQKFSYRVLKEEVLDLPEETWGTRELKLKGEQASAYKKAEEEFYFAVDAVKKRTGQLSENTVLIQNALSRLTRCQQIASGHCRDEKGQVILWPDNPKTAEIVETIRESGDQKAVIFSRFKEDLHLAHQALTGAGIPSALFTGDQSREARAETEQVFLKSNDLKVVLAQTHAGGLGVNFSGANLGLWINNWFSWHIRDQCQSRLHRLGQTRNVHYIDYVVVNSVDETVLSAVLEKKSLSEMLFGLKVAAFDSGG